MFDVKFGGVVFQEMMLYNQVNTLPLSKGLYLGYLKLKSSVDLIRIMVPERTPNVLPHVRIRDCNNVSRYVTHTFIIYIMYMYGRVDCELSGCWFVSGS